MNREDFSVATFNLFNLQEPGKPMTRGKHLGHQTNSN
jgi:hypothetical protein